jgi:poly(3-hydroxyalkanoate) synthetase
MPMATIVGLKDNLVPPESTERFLDHVGSADVTRFQLPTGHIGLSVSRAAHRDLWPPFADWVLAHSQQAPPEASTKPSRPASARRRSGRRRSTRARKE